MKKLGSKVIALAIILAVLVFSCENGLMGNQDSMTLSNGVELSAAEVETLSAMEDDAMDIVNSVMAASNRSIDDEMTQEEKDAVIEGWIDLLKAEFGDDYEKYIVIKEALPVTKDPITRNGIVGNAVYFSYAWGSHSRASTEYISDASSIYVKVSDANGSVSRSLSNKKSVYVDSNFRYGFFADPYPCNTTHQVTDSSLTGGSYSFTASWSKP